MYYIGLMAGTSFDGVDCALTHEQGQLVHYYYQAYPDAIINALRSLTYANSRHTLADIAKLDIAIAQFFAKSANTLIQQSGVKKTDIIAIGSHGQTIYHAPQYYSWQIAHPNIIAQQTGLSVVADFRMADIATNGQGAPLAPVYHQYLLQGNNGVIVNLGGIANITIAQNTTTQHNTLLGFDCGPANTLLDNWIKQTHNKPYDKNGDWANSGTIIPDLLTKLLADDYFQQAPPKSTGFEYFNLAWLSQHLNNNEASADVQATLLALTTHSIAQNIPADLPVYLCGGGVHNTALATQLKTLCPSNIIDTTQALGMHPDYLEAAAFGFFAQQTLKQKPSNNPSTTGADKFCVLGGVYRPFNAMHKF